MHFNEIADAANAIIADASLPHKLTQIDVSYNLNNNTTCYTLHALRVNLPVYGEGLSVADAAHDLIGRLTQ